ncbi:MAG: DUF2914 domain-containing protein [Deferrisomatales bacterium]
MPASAVRRLAALGVAGLLGASPAWAGLAVSRQAFARDVVAREPVGAAERFPADVGELVFFTQVLGGGEGADLLHVWIHGGQELMIVPLEVEGPSWRTWSRKNVFPGLTGDWTVEVRDLAGAVLSSATCRVE